MDIKYYVTRGENDRLEELSDDMPSVKNLSYMCLINNGNEFVLKYKEPYYYHCFKKGFFGLVCEYSCHKSSHLEYEKLETMSWPLGVSVQSELLSYDKNPKEPGTVPQYKLYTLSVSKEYSNSIYKKEKELFKNKDFVGKIYDYLNDYYLAKNHEIKIYEKEVCVDFGKCFVFKEHGLMDLPVDINYDYRFILARKLARYIECRYGLEVIGSITFWGSSVILKYDFKDKKNNIGLTNWFD